MTSGRRKTRPQRQLGNARALFWNLNGEGWLAARSTRGTCAQFQSSAGHDGHAINTRQPKMDRSDEKQPVTRATPETSAPAASPIVMSGPPNANAASGR